MKAVTVKALEEHLGEAIHTSFRRATECPEAEIVWNNIKEMPLHEWVRF